MSLLMTVYVGPYITLSVYPTKIEMLVTNGCKVKVHNETLNKWVDFKTLEPVDGMVKLPINVWWRVGNEVFRGHKLVAYR